MAETLLDNTSGKTFQAVGASIRRIFGNRTDKTIAEVNAEIETQLKQMKDAQLIIQTIFLYEMEQILSGTTEPPKPTELKYVWYLCMNTKDEDLRPLFVTQVESKTLTDTLSNKQGDATPSV